MHLCYKRKSYCVLCSLVVHLSTCLFVICFVNSSICQLTNTTLSKNVYLSICQYEYLLICISVNLSTKIDLLILETIIIQFTVHKFKIA